MNVIPKGRWFMLQKEMDLRGGRGPLIPAGTKGCVLIRRRDGRLWVSLERFGQRHIKPNTAVTLIPSPHTPAIVCSLKRCPCCGHEARLEFPTYAAEVRCTNLNCGLKVYRGVINSRTLKHCIEQVVRVWNRRVNK